MRFNSTNLHLRLDPRDPAFYADPDAAYRAMRDIDGPVFWEDYGFWVFARHADVCALLRDRRFGRQILHLASRAELGWPERPAHVADFERPDIFYVEHAPNF